MGDFWGFQEAWLSLVASVFDMAIYPTLFVAYLSRFLPWAGVNRHGIIVGVAVIALSAVLNLAGIRAVSTNFHRVISGAFGPVRCDRRFVTLPMGKSRAHGFRIVISPR
jgi:amino acid transporter